MPSTRRSVLAAAAAVVAGCTGGPAGTGDSTGTTPPTGETTTPVDAPSFAHWSYALPYEAPGTLTLAPGPDGPAVYASSSAERANDGGTDAPHSLVALSLPDGSEQWRASLPDPVQFGPLHGGTGGVPRLYLATGRESLHGEASRFHAFDPSRGKRVWGFDTEARRFLLPLAATEDAVFVGQRDDQLAPTGENAYALDAGDGSERWRVGSGDARRDGNEVRRGTFFLRSSRRLQALAASSGDRRWQFRAERRLHGPTFDNRGERLFVGRNGAVMALDVETGRELWRREFGFTLTRVTSPREAMSETVFVGDYDGRLLAMSPLDGQTRWTYSVDRDQFYPTVERTSESLYLGGAGVHALDPVSGERKWSFAPDVEGAIDVHASTTIFASGGHDDAVWALDPSTGERRWEFDLDSAVVGPVTAGDVAVVGVDGAVHALDGSRSP